MLSRILPITTVIVTAVGMAGLLQLTPVSAKDNSGQDNHVSVTLCHATGSQKNPYVQITVDDSSVDEQHNADLNGHGDHTGPVWHEGITTKWGDIIPAFKSGDNTYPGMNIEEGQAILDNGCEVPTAPVEEGMAKTSVTAMCVVADQVVKLTFVNSGTAESTVSVSGKTSTVAAGATVNVTTPITGATVAVNVVIDGKAQTLTVNCPTGGSGSIVTPSSNGNGSTSTSQTTNTSASTPAVVVRGGSGTAGEVESLPVTSGSSDAIVAISTLVSSVVAAAGAYVIRMRGALQL